jgi:predicted phage terminase large subunit-like protein
VTRRQRRPARQSLLGWCTEVLSDQGLVPARHHEFLIDHLEMVANGIVDRLMITMPPGSAKTTYSTKLFPPYFMRRGNVDVIGASHGAELAEVFSGDVIRTINNQAKVLEFGLLNESVKFWRTSNGCTYRAAGAGGSITGRRADLFIIDDPIKGREDADSQTIRDKVWDWYRAEVITRLKPGARIVLILTRWHEDDLAGRLLQEMQIGGDQWLVLNLPAIAEEDDPLGRDPGEALWPEWEDTQALERKRRASGEREWFALYQQRPHPIEGSIFQVSQIGIISAAPAGGMLCRGWDLAATKEGGGRDPSWTRGVLLQRAPDGRFVVRDVASVRGGPDEVERAIKNTAQQDGHRVKISLPQDPGQAGKSQVLYYTRALSGFSMEATPETGDKATRAAGIVSQCNNGNVSLLEGYWNRGFLDELAAFPSGAHDDQVDALSRAFSVVGLSPKPLEISDALLARARAQSVQMRRRF